MKQILNENKNLNYNKKEELLALLLILEKQEKPNNQEPAFASRQIDD